MHLPGFLKDIEREMVRTSFVPTRVNKEVKVIPAMPAICEYAAYNCDDGTGFWCGVAHGCGLRSLKWGDH